MKYVVMIGPDPEAQGGIASVIRAYRDHGLFDRWPVLFLPTFVEGPKIKNALIGVRSLLHYVARLMIGHVALTHAHVAQRTSFVRKAVFLLLSLFFRRPIIFHLHGHEFDKYYETQCGGRRKYIIRYLLDRAAYVVVLSPYWKNWISRVTCNGRIECLYNPVEIHEYKVVEDAKPFNVLFLGRLGERKGTYDLLKAVALLHERHRTLQVICGGDGELDKTRKLAEELGIASRVRLVGWVKGHDKERLLSEAAVLILPSYHEGLPMAVLEAMAHGVPIISTHVGGIPDIIENGREGILIAPGDVIALADSLERLLKNPPLRIAMGKVAHEKAVSLFAVDKVLTQLSTLYSSLGVSHRE
jgi:glycosyltransferase involved in cell wall biosynthesis